MTSLSFLSFLITLMLAAAVCTNGEEQVKDTAGNSVQTGEQYFIQPVNTGKGSGGLVPAPIAFPFSIYTCPLGINQALGDFLPGLPVTFAYPNPTLMETNADVYTMKDVNFKFKSDFTWPFCDEFPKLWKVDESSPVSVEPPILIGGIQQDRSSWFRIVKDGNVVGGGGDIYKLTTSTGTIGFTPTGWFGAPKLVLTNDEAKTLYVKFKKVGDATTSTSRVQELGLRMFPFY